MPYQWSEHLPEQLVEFQQAFQIFSSPKNLHKKLWKIPNLSFKMVLPSIRYDMGYSDSRGPSKYGLSELSG